MKICKGNGLTINQNAQIHDENYIVVNDSNYSTLQRAWVLWQAEDRFFTPRNPNLNLRTILAAVAAPNVEVIFDATPATGAHGTIDDRIPAPLSMAKAALPAKAPRPKQARSP